MSFKIYQIHEYGGEWEDAFDYIVGSYLSEEKAIAEKERMEIEEESIRELYEKCHNCPLYRLYKYDEEKISIEEYCDKYEPFDENKHSLDEYDGDERCVNYIWYYDDTCFRIKEVEVIE